ncbi:Cloroperoxidase [Gymnopus androsaceus JB14]|uniref:Cloroperoxidase n=1 Tax=Gymnopus androsaceus JB14 TaxID=1447944 RepID=A0A6A4HHD9_9AGAR|nr:Cloroperoxidase [Gymnopus androsaceus JB14]
MRFTLEAYAADKSLTPPLGHPHATISMHDHSDGICIVTGRTNGFCPPQHGDLRSVCPALNAMANHGYIPRDGQNITFGTLFKGLKSCYGLSSPLAAFLVMGGFLLISRSPFHIPYLLEPNGDGVIDLHLIGKHNGLEHDASLVHKDTPRGEKYAPTEIKQSWVLKLIGDILPPVSGYLGEETSQPSIGVTPNETVSETGTLPTLRRFIDDPVYLTTLVDEADVGRMRARRQREILPRRLDAVHQELACRKHGNPSWGVEHRE